ncbi:MAG TPA: TolC family protein [Vicinamibacterales bacterium]|nr:TolC family protein [Vicinamibacterales bacterium]
MRIVVRGVALALPLVISQLAAPAVCRAQTRLSLQEAVNTALQSRALLKAEAERVSVAEGRKRQAAVMPNPEFQFANENLRPGQTYSRDVDTLAYVTWPLDVLGKREQRMAVAGVTVNRREAELELMRRQVAQSVRLAYWTALGAQERRDLLHSTVANFQRIIDYHAAQLRVGTIAEQDLLRVRLEGERIQIAAHLAAIDATKARVDLLKAIGETGLSNIVLTEALDTIPPAIGASPIEDVLANRKEIAVAAAGVDEARADVRLQDVSARPDLAIVFGYKRTQLPDALSGVNTLLAGVKVTLPLTDRNQGNRAAAAAELRRQAQLHAEVETTVRADVERAAQEYEMRRLEVVDTLQPLREHARTIANIAQAAYQQGGFELLRLLDAERARLEAESAWVDGMVAFQQSVVNLQAAQGVSR